MSHVVNTCTDMFGRRKDRPASVQVSTWGGIRKRRTGRSDTQPETRRVCRDAAGASHRCHRVPATISLPLAVSQPSEGRTKCREPAPYVRKPPVPPHDETEGSGALGAFR